MPYPHHEPLRRRSTCPLPTLFLVALLATSLPGSTAALSGEDLPATDDGARALVDGYLEAWHAFHPSRAARLGAVEAIFGLEDRSAAAVAAWVAANEATLAEAERLADPRALSPAQLVDLRLLRAEVRRELATWRDDEQAVRSLAVYADPISAALPAVLGSETLTRGEVQVLVGRRLAAIERLALAAQASWRGEERRDAETGLEKLRATRDGLAAGAGLSSAGSSQGATAPFAGERAAALRALDELIARVEQRLPELEERSPVLGAEAYARGLSLYLDRDTTPEELLALADAQIEDAKAEVRRLSREYLVGIESETASGDADALVRRAIEAVGARRPTDNPEYLEELRGYGGEIERFVRERGLATMPDNHTLSIEIAPESAAEMARVGFVDSAPPLAPNPWTTWYLATIPDDFPEQERIDFWRSFNYAYKKFIVVHELFPGHYLQQKLLRENPHPVRIHFPWQPFTEGWATFCEEVAFEHGWAEGDHLVRLAQQLKRLENANRAFMSVQAHVNGWSEQRVYETSIERAWLAPQFAKSLWHRLMNWPFQMTTYMLGGLELQDLYGEEKQRLGDDFSTREFMDTVLRLGPIPIDEMGRFLRQPRTGEMP